MTAAFWTFDRPQRLQDLVDRAREQEMYSLRERCDRHDPGARARIDARLAAIRHRLQALRAAARSARREARAPAVGA